MAVTSTVTSRAVLGSKRMAVGTVERTGANGSDNSGNIDTGLSVVEFITGVMQGGDTSGNYTAPLVVNSNVQTLPYAGGTVNVWFGDYSGNGTGIWQAYGR